MIKYGAKSWKIQIQRRIVYLEEFASGMTRMEMRPCLRIWRWRRRLQKWRKMEGEWRVGFNISSQVFPIEVFGVIFICCNWFFYTHCSLLLFLLSLVILLIILYGSFEVGCLGKIHWMFGWGFGIRVWNLESV